MPLILKASFNKAVVCLAFFPEQLCSD